MKKKIYLGADDGKPRTNTAYGGLPDLDYDAHSNDRDKALWRQLGPRKRKKAKVKRETQKH